MQRFEAKTVVLLTLPALALLLLARWQSTPPRQAHGLVVEGFVLPPTGPTPAPLSKREYFFSESKLQQDVIGFGVKFEPPRQWSLWGTRTPQTFVKCFGVKVFDAATGQEMYPIMEASGSGYYFKSSFFKSSDLQKLSQGIVVKAPVGWSIKGVSHFAPLQFRLSLSDLKSLPEAPGDI